MHFVTLFIPVTVNEKQSKQIHWTIKTRQAHWWLDLEASFETSFIEKAPRVTNWVTDL